MSVKREFTWTCVQRNNTISHQGHQQNARHSPPFFPANLSMENQQQVTTATYESIPIAGAFIEPRWKMANLGTLVARPHTPHFTEL